MKGVNVMNNTTNLLKYFNQEFKPLGLKAYCRVDKLVLEDSLGVVFESTTADRFFDHLGDIKAMYID